MKHACLIALVLAGCGEGSNPDETPATPIEGRYRIQPGRTTITGCDNFALDAGAPVEGTIRASVLKLGTYDFALGGVSLEQVPVTADGTVRQELGERTRPLNPGSMRLKYYRLTSGSIIDGSLTLRTETLYWEGTSTGGCTSTQVDTYTGQWAAPL